VISSWLWVVDGNSSDGTATNSSLLFMMNPVWFCPTDGTAKAIGAAEGAQRVATVSCWTYRHIMGEI
jgi:hypothetical protein